ncbi:hypothetical protein M758_2G183500 [Ceratodon purpureus]|nr:hypothetical protein M758_2G183300 [Ceratodon purpureus]KAG0627223.1 hypothetical protein M758_2G183500 [Ceratodon purpureus]
MEMDHAIRLVYRRTFKFTISFYLEEAVTLLRMYMLTLIRLAQCAVSSFSVLSRPSVCRLVLQFFPLHLGAIVFQSHRQVQYWFTHLSGCGCWFSSSCSSCCGSSEV